MTREEVSVVVGVDVSQMERGLGIGKNYFNNWSKALKTEQQKYTEWWATELKKREEMETESSVRAATRSNAARRLVRQRAADRQESIASEIGQGSIPASWTGDAKAYAAATEVAGQSLSKFGKIAGKFFFHLRSFTFVGLGVAALKAFDFITAAAANKLYGNGSVLEQLKTESLERDRQYWHKEYEMFLKNKELQIQKEKEFAATRSQVLSVEEGLLEARAQQKEQAAGRDSMEALRIKVNLAEELEARKKLAHEEAKAGDDALARQKALLEYERAKNATAEATNALLEKRNEKDRIYAEAQKESAGIKQHELESFMPTIEELSKRGAFTGTARSILNLRRKAHQDALSGNIKQERLDIESMNKLEHQLAVKGVRPEVASMKEQAELAKRTADAIGRIENGSSVIKVQAQTGK